MEKGDLTPGALLIYCLVLLALLYFLLSLGWGHGICRLYRVQSFFPYWSCVSYCPSFLGMSCLVSSAHATELSFLLSSSFWKQPLRILLSLKNYVKSSRVPICTSNNSKQAPFLGAEIQLKSPQFSLNAVSWVARESGD